MKRTLRVVPLGIYIHISGLFWDILLGFFDSRNSFFFLFLFLFFFLNCVPPFIYSSFAYYKG